MSGTRHSVAVALAPLAVENLEILQNQESILLAAASTQLPLLLAPMLLLQLEQYAQRALEAEILADLGWPKEPQPILVAVSRRGWQAALLLLMVQQVPVVLLHLALVVELEHLLRAKLAEASSTWLLGRQVEGHGTSHQCKKDPSECPPAQL